MSVFAAEKEGKSFVNSIKNDNMRAQVADATGIKNEEKNNNNKKENFPSIIPMEKSIFDIDKKKMMA